MEIVSFIIVMATIVVLVIIGTHIWKGHHIKLLINQKEKKNILQRVALLQNHFLKEIRILQTGTRKLLISTHIFCTIKCHVHDCLLPYNELCREKNSFLPM